MKPQLLINPSTAGNISTQSNCLFTFKAKLLKGRLDRFTSQVRLGSAEWSQGIRNLFVCSKIFKHPILCQQHWLKCFHSCLWKILQVSMPPTQLAMGKLWAEDFPALALMAAAQEKTDDRVGLPGACAQAAATGFYHTSSPSSMSPPHQASCSPLTVEPTISLCTSDADNRTMQGCDSQHELGVHSTILWSCFLEVLIFIFIFLHHAHRSTAARVVLWVLPPPAPLRTLLGPGGEASTRCGVPTSKPLCWHHCRFWAQDKKQQCPSRNPGSTLGSGQTWEHWGKLICAIARHTADVI